MANEQKIGKKLINTLLRDQDLQTVFNQDSLLDALQKA